MALLVINAVVFVDCAVTLSSLLPACRGGELDINAWSILVGLLFAPTALINTIQRLLCRRKKSTKRKMATRQQTFREVSQRQRWRQRWQYQRSETEQDQPRGVSSDDCALLSSCVRLGQEALLDTTTTLTLLVSTTSELLAMNSN